MTNFNWLWASNIAIILFWLGAKAKQRFQKAFEPHFVAVVVVVIVAVNRPLLPGLLVLVLK